MTNEQKYDLLEYRLKILESRDKENFGVCRKIRREMRHLKKAE